MVEEGIRGGICHSVHRFAKANNKYMKNYNNNEESSYIQYLDANNLYGWAMSKKLPVNGFKWIDNSETAEHVINEGNDNKGYILEVDVKHPNDYMNDIVIYHSYLKELKLINVTNSFVIYLIKKIRHTHKFIKTSVKSWIKVKKNSENH